MPLRLEIKKMMSSRSDRVKCVDMHPLEPWVLAALYNGNVFIWDYEQASLVKSFEICSLPVRCAKFIVRKQWFIAASDDMNIRVYNYNTMEKINAWEAHTDYIRYLEVHPTQPYVLSCADDMSIRLWDWDRGWDCIQVFEGHAHYVMMVKVNTKDSNTFASASLDRTVKVWGLGSNTHHFALEGHERGVNCIDYYPGGDRPYLISGADDKTVKLWDYQTKTCVQTLSGHHNNVSAVIFHPRLPIIISGSEDGTVRLWHSTTYRAETTLNYGMERVWAVAAASDSNKLVIGFDEGTVVLKLGHETPVASLDTHTGKVVWAQNCDIQTASLKGVVAESGCGDGERLPLVTKDLGSTEIFPQALKHNCNGRFLVVCGDGEYIIYTSQALRNKAFGPALDFVWSAVGTGDYAIRDSITRVKTFRNFKEQHTLRPPLAASEGLFGGACLGVRGTDAVVFFDWDEGIMIRKIDVSPKEVYWSEAGDLVLLACEDSYFVLKYDASAVATAIQEGRVDSEEGVEAAFELISQLQGKIQTGLWVGACFLYTTDQSKLNYYVGGEVMTLCHLSCPMHMLGYLPKEDRVYLMDKSLNIFSYKVLQSYLQYQTAVVRKDFQTANALLPSIPVTEYTAVARFLESQGFKEEALAVSRDPDHKFDLACELGHLPVAKKLLDDMPPEEYDTLDAQSKWKRLGDLALSNCDLALVEKCATNSSDFGGLLMLHSATGNSAGMAALADVARKAGKNNVAFLALLLCGRVEECLDLLVAAGRLPEAAFMARTYLPSEISRIMGLWKESLKNSRPKAAEALADPAEYPNLFEDIGVALQVERIFKERRGTPVPAGMWPQAKDTLDLDLIALVKAQGIPQAPVQSVPTPAAVEIPRATSPPQSPRAASPRAVGSPKSSPPASPRVTAPAPAANHDHDAHAAEQQAEKERELQAEKERQLQVEREREQERVREEQLRLQMQQMAIEKEKADKQAKELADKQERDRVALEQSTADAASVAQAERRAKAMADAKAKVELIKKAAEESAAAKRRAEMEEKAHADALALASTADSNGAEESKGGGMGGGDMDDDDEEFGDEW